MKSLTPGGVIQRTMASKGGHHSTLQGHPRLPYKEAAKINSEPKISTDIPTLLAKPIFVPTALIKIKHDGKWNEIRVAINPTRKVTLLQSWHRY